MYFVKGTSVATALAVFLVGGSTTQAQFTFNWDEPLGGEYWDPSNWIPQGPPTLLDYAVFNTPAAAYTVTFDVDPTAGFGLIADRASILGDDVIFDLEGRLYTLIGAGGEGLRVEEVLSTGSLEIIDGRVNTTGHAYIDSNMTSVVPQLNIHSGGKFAAHDLTIGENTYGWVEVNSDGRLEVEDHLNIGYLGAADFILDGNFGPATVSVNPTGNGITHLADQPGGSATVIIDGSQALWETNIFALGRGSGMGGAAIASVSNDAHLVVTDAIVIGNDPASSLDLSGGKITAGRILTSLPGQFVYNYGTLELTNSYLTVGSSGLLGSTIIATTGNHISISETTTVQAGATIDIDGGSFSTGVLDVQGDPSRLNWLSGHLGLSAQDLYFGPGELLGSIVSIDPSRSLTIGGTTILDSGSWLSIDGGTFSTGSIDHGGDPSPFSFNWGEFNLTASDLLIDNTGLLGNYVIVDPLQKLGVSQSTVIPSGSYLEINGGTFSTGYLVHDNDPLRFQWTEGTLNLTDPNHYIDLSAGGLLGDTLVLDSLHTLGANGELVVQPDGTLHVEEGSLTVGQSTDHRGPRILRVDTGGTLNVYGNAVVGSTGMPAGYGILTIESDGTVELTGGHIMADDIDYSAPGAVFDWQSGTLQLRSVDLLIEPGGYYFGNELMLEGGQKLILGEEGIPGPPGVLYVGSPGGTGKLILREGGEADTAAGFVDINGIAVVQGKDSKWAVRDTFDVAGGGLLWVESGGTVEAFYASVSGDTFNGPGFAVIEGPGALLHATEQLDVFDDAHLYVRDTARLHTRNAYVTSYTSGQNPNVNVIGPGSTWQVDQLLQIGDNTTSSTNASVYTDFGAVLDARDADIVILSSGSLGVFQSLLVADTLTETQQYSIGTSGPDTVLRVNQLNIVGSSNWYDCDLQFGHSGGSASGSFDSLGMDLTITGILTVGYDATASVAFTNASVAHNTCVVIGETATGLGNLLVEGSLIDTTGSMTVGLLGNGVLTIDDGHVNSTLGIIAADAGSTGHVDLDDNGNWLVTGTLYVGGDLDPIVDEDAGGDATIDILNGSALSTTGGMIAFDTGSTGVVTVSGTNSRWLNSTGLVDETEWLIVGVRDAGELHIDNGGWVRSGVITTGVSLVNYTPTASGIITVDGNNSLLEAQGLLMVGGADSSSVTASNNARITTQNVDVFGNGTLLIESSATIDSTTEVFIGQQNVGAGNAYATVTGLGSDWTHSGTLVVGEHAHGHLTVADQATMSSVDTTIGRNNTPELTADGHVTVSGNAQMDINGILIVGSAGLGDLRITTGGRVVVPNSPEIVIGFLPPSNGLIEVTGTDSELDATGQNIVLGQFTGTGELQIRDGAAVLSASGEVGDNFDAIGTVLIENPGSIWDLSGELKIGASANGTVTVQDSGAGTSDTVVIGSASGSNGTLNIGDNADWTMTGNITVGRSGESYLNVTGGGQVSNVSAFIADNGGSIGQAHIYGPGSEWNNSGSMYVGGDSSSSGGSGTLIAGNGLGTGGTVNITNALKVRTPGAVQLNGGVINTGRLGTVEGTWTWGSGELNLTDPTFDFVVGAAGPFGASLTIPTDNRMTVAGETIVESGAVLNTTDYVCNNVVINEGTIISSGEVILGNTAIYKAYSGNGSLVVGAHSVTLNSLGFLEVDFPLTITGGTLTAPNGLLFEPAYMLSAHGEIDTRLAIPMGTTITATGDLTLGDVTATDGYFSDGILEVASHTVTLADANLAVLGSLTTLNGGAMAAPNGILIEFGKNVSGYGGIDTPNNPLKPTINNGDVVGSSLLEPITLTGYVKGVGTYDNVLFLGTFAPGFSPATVYLGSAQYAGSLEIELGGLAEGDSDLLHHNGDLILGGTLDVQLWDGFVPMPGSVIDIMTYSGTLSGAFTDVVNSTGYVGLILGYASDTDSVMITTGYLTGDLNLDGFVGLDDLDIVLGAWNQYVTVGDIFQGDPTGDGYVGLDDLDTILGNWNAGTPPVVEAGPMVPEPGSVVVLALSGLAILRRRQVDRSLYI